MRLTRYITELSVAKKPKIKYIKKETLFHADIRLDMELFDNRDLFYFDANLDAIPSFYMAKFKFLKNAYEDYQTEITTMGGDPLTTDNPGLSAPAIWIITFEDNMAHFETEQKAKGVAINLFAALEMVFKEFIKIHDPLVFEFSAATHEESRMKLYDLIAKRIVKAGYELQTAEGMDRMYLFIKKTAETDWWKYQHYINPY